MLSRRGTTSTLSPIYRGYIPHRLEHACAICCCDNTVKLPNFQHRWCCRHRAHMAPLHTKSQKSYFSRWKPQRLSRISNPLPKPIKQLQSNFYYHRKMIYPVPVVKPNSSLTSPWPNAVTFGNRLIAFLPRLYILYSFQSRLKAHLNKKM